MLAVPGIRGALRTTAAPVVGLSPIIGGAVVRGMADICLQTLGVGVDAESVGRMYGGRSEGGLLGGWLVADGDTAEIEGVRVEQAPLLMSDDDATAEMARTALGLVGVTA